MSLSIKTLVDIFCEKYLSQQYIKFIFFDYLQTKIELCIYFDYFQTKI